MKILTLQLCARFGIYACISVSLVGVTHIVGGRDQCLRTNERKGRQPWRNGCRTTQCARGCATPHQKTWTMMSHHHARGGARQNSCSVCCSSSVARSPESCSFSVMMCAARWSARRASCRGAQSDCLVGSDRRRFANVTWRRAIPIAVQAATGKCCDVTTLLASPQTRESPRSNSSHRLTDDGLTHL